MYTKSTWEALNLIEDRSQQVRTLSDLVGVYLGTRFYQELKPHTKGTYDSYLRRILDKFGDVPLSVFEERGARTAVRRWRDEVLSAQLRTADAIVGMLRRVLNFAVDEEYIARNPVAGLGRIYTKTRRDIIWTDAQISTFLATAPRHLARVLLLAVWTGQRQSDLLNLTWSAYDGKYLRLQQRKASKGSSGRRVKILVSGELRNILAEIKSEQAARSSHSDPRKHVPQPDTILTTGRGRPWRGGFKCAWRTAAKAAGISGVTFHDLRGTFITLSHRAGATMKEISEASGHEETVCERVIRQHYLAAGSEQVISRLELSKRFASGTWDQHGQQEVVRFTGPRSPRDHRESN